MNSITLMPYTKVDGVPTFRDSEIEDVYSRVCREGWGDKMWHDGTLNSPQEFLAHIKSNSTMFWGVYHENELMGFFWVNRIYMTHAFLHFAFFKKWWGRYPEIMSAGKKALELLLVEEFNGKPLFDLILGMYPSWNKHVLSYVLRHGAKVAESIPNLVWSKRDGKSVEGVIVSIVKGDIK